MDMRFGWGVPDTLFADPVDYFTRVEAPPVAARFYGRTQPARFEVEYVDFPAEARAAFEAALNIWSNHVSSSVPIRVRAQFSAFDRENVLGSASPRLVANFTNALEPNVWFATALANAIAGRALDPQNPEITTNFNINFPHWYFGTAGNPGEGQYDFLSVVLHEIGHGLGFVGSMVVTDGQGAWGLGTQGFPIIFDIFAETDLDGVTTRLLDTSRFPNPSSALARALTSNRVYFNGPVSVEAQIESQAAQGLPVGPGGRPKLHAPSQWREGSSYSHLTGLPEPGQPEMYPAGSLNSLMTPTIGAREVVHTPGAVTCGMFRDMGWPLGPGCQALVPEPPPPIDELLLVVGPCPHPAVGGTTRIRVHVRDTQRVRVDVYDVVGRRVARAFDGMVRAAPLYTIGDQPACVPAVGEGYVSISTLGLASGTYIVRVRTSEATEAVRMTVLN
jgi:hypothetical protein